MLAAASCWLRCFVLGHRQALAFQRRAVVLLQIVHALRGDRQSRLVAARDQLLRNQIPEGELEVLAGPSDQHLHVTVEHAWRVRLDAPLRTQHLEDGQARQLLELEVGGALRSGLNELPAVLPLPLMEDVVLRPPLGVAEHGVGVNDRAELLRVAGFPIVWMKPLRLDPVHTMNRLGIRVDADLEQLVVVVRDLGHGTLSAAVPTWRGSLVYGKYRISEPGLHCCRTTSWARWRSPRGFVRIDVQQSAATVGAQKATATRIRSFRWWPGPTGIRSPLSVMAIDPSSIVSAGRRVPPCSNRNRAASRLPMSRTTRPRSFTTGPDTFPTNAEASVPGRSEYGNTCSDVSGL